MVKKHMACIACGWRIFATIEQAKKHDWELWVGGARCSTCVAAGSEPASPQDACSCGHERAKHYGLRGPCLATGCSTNCEKFSKVA